MLVIVRCVRRFDAVGRHLQCFVRWPVLHPNALRPTFLNTSVIVRTMKRKAASSEASPQAKRQAVQLPDYCDTPLKKADDGSEIWPAPREAMTRARAFIREWYV